MFEIPSSHSRLDVGLCLPLLKARLDIPVLGVCLGHQGMGLEFGANVRNLQYVLFNAEVGTFSKGSSWGSL